METIQPELYVMYTGQGQSSLWETHHPIVVVICAKYAKIHPEL